MTMMDGPMLMRQIVIQTPSVLSLSQSIQIPMEFVITWTQTMMVMVGAMFKKMNVNQMLSLHSVGFHLLILIVILLQVIVESYTLVESIHLNSVT